MNYERLLAPLRRRMATLIGRCILSAVRSGEGFQTLDVVIMADESMGGVEHAETAACAGTHIENASALFHAGYDLCH